MSLEHDLARDGVAVAKGRHAASLPPDIDLGALAGKISASPRQTCEALGFGLTKVYELLGSGELASYHEGKARRILVSSIRSYVARRIAEAPTQAA